MSESYPLLIPRPKILVPHPACSTTTAHLFEGQIPRTPYGQGGHCVGWKYPENPADADYEKPVSGKGAVFFARCWRNFGTTVWKKFPVTRTMNFLSNLMLAYR